MAKSRDAFRTISEVAEWLETPAHVLRFWESKFTQIKPVKRAGGRRYYRPADMKLLGGIKQLLHEDGMTIKGVQKVLRENGVRHVASLNSYAVDDESTSGEQEIIDDAPYIEVDVPDSVVAFPGAAAVPEEPETLEMFPDAQQETSDAAAPEALSEEMTVVETDDNEPALNDVVPSEETVSPMEEEPETQEDAKPEAEEMEETVDSQDNNAISLPSVEIAEPIPRPSLLGLVARISSLSPDQASTLRPHLSKLRSEHEKTRAID